MKREEKGGETERGEGVRRRGKCKWFNVVKGYGFITPDDGGPEVFLHQTVIQMPGFRSLGEGEAVEFECAPSDKGYEATLVCGVEGAQCRGSDRRPVSKKKHKKLRCYNCGEFASHVAARCPQGPLPKRCHICKSSDHLVADCPQRPPSGSESTPGEGSTSSESAPLRVAGVGSPLGTAGDSSPLGGAGSSSISSPQASQPTQSSGRSATALSGSSKAEEEAGKSSKSSTGLKKDSSGGAASPPVSHSSASPRKPSEPKS